jgi:alpha-glucosidase
MQWDGSRFAGFSSVEPWLSLSEDAAVRNVDTQRGDPASIFNLYRRLLALRRQHPALATGLYRPIEAEGDVLAFLREQESERFLVALNFGDGPAAAVLPAEYQGTVVFALRADREGERLRGRIDLAGNDGMLVRLD